MSGDHHHSHHPHRNIANAFFFNLGFAIVELAAGFAANSNAVLSGALHDLGDAVALAVVWYFQKLSEKERNTVYTYGYKRFSILAGLITSVILCVGSIAIIIRASMAFNTPSEPKGGLIIGVAILGIFFNWLAMKSLRKGESLNEKITTLHFIEDILGWTAILVSGIIIYFTNFKIIDNIFSIAIALFILYNASRNLRSVLRIFLQAVPQEVSINVAEKALLSVENVKEVHDLHVWSMDGQFNILTGHVVVDGTTTLAQAEIIKERCRSIMASKGVNHTTLEIELPGMECRHEHKI